MRILIIEDHADIAGNVGDYLTQLGHVVDYADQGDMGLRMVIEHTYDGIILDINLPKMDGFTLCQQLRQTHHISTPVLMLTARASLADKMKGFQVGAWDYLVKPFALAELGARIDALMLRNETNQPRRLQVGELLLDTRAQCATREGQPLSLHQACIQILALLMQSHPNVVSRSDLEQLLWGDDAPPASDPLRSHIHELRRVMDKPFAYPMLKTERGLGYRLVRRDAP